MSQTILSIVADVVPASAPVLSGLIEDFRRAEETLSPAFPVPYDRIKAALPNLHFMSLTVFADPQYDPILVMECNFDGAGGPFFAQLEAAYPQLLRDMLRCCKTPPKPVGDMFDVIVAQNSRAPIAPLLEVLTVRPAVFHQGNRGMARDRILRERDLFKAVRDGLNAGAYNGLDIVAVHRSLRADMLKRFDWLAEPKPPLITPAEDRADRMRLGAFIVLALVALAAPGVILGLALPVWLTGFLLTGVFALAAAKLNWLRELDLALGKPISSWLAGYAFILPVAGLISSWVQQHFATNHEALWRVLIPVLSGVLAIPVSALLLLVWLRALESRDPSLDAPVQDEAALRALAHSEDQIDQNHMISIVYIKPGVLRAILIRVGLHGLGLVLRVIARDGYLATMRTIHFAHWGVISDGGRLMFHSNFDGTWESYLDDFIEKAHGGLTLAWCCGVGFPPTRFLVLDGATRGRFFKNWARHSMTPSLFWFSAYLDQTVNQIERQRRIADGLRKAQLSQQEAEAWSLDL
ncbi:hypothetical protein [Methylocella sp.]|uniref:hypothetical protein n=1 Tax=Methylocella sp. TaxID=1978226 RepID=UPI003C24E048